MTTKSRAPPTRREKIVRKVAAELGKTMTDVAADMGFKHPSQLYSALRTKVPQATTVARIRDGLRSYGVEITIAELAR